MGKKKRMATLWEVPDPLWERIEPILDATESPRATGRPRINRRRVLDGIIFRLRTGCQWNHIPSVYGDDSTIHRCFQRWCEQGIFEKIWAMLVDECDELQGVNWEWQAADTALGKARFGGALLDRTPPTARKKAQNAAF